MARLELPVMNTSLRAPALSASSAAYWISGLSTMGSISLGLALVAGRKRVPRPATGNTAVLIACATWLVTALSVPAGGPEWVRPMISHRHDRPAAIGPAAGMACGRHGLQPARPAASKACNRKEQR